MPPENDPSQSASELAVHDIEWDGPWGSIAPSPRTIEILSVQIESEAGKPRIYYFPYRTIGKWNWSMDPPEALEIQVGGIQLTISGTGLRRLAEALNEGQLRLVQCSPLSDVGGEIRIRSILVEELKS
jgi:hypothetical protein